MYSSKVEKENDTGQAAVTRLNLKLCGGYEGRGKLEKPSVFCFVRSRGKKKGRSRKGTGMPRKRGKGELPRSLPGQQPDNLFT